MTDEPLESHQRPDKGPSDAVDLSQTVASTDGEATRFTCPDCGGVLFESEQGSLLRYKCSVGHAFSVESLDAEQAHAVENALWTAVRTLEDRVILVSRLAERARRGGHPKSAQMFEHQGHELAARAHTIRGAIDRLTLPIEEAL
jgi:two-component system, chemotaxis family, protein-glutamate methylesterase/glutaminase